ncbi:MAG: hypothetical protein DSO04_02865 [Hadesarchaea archaeon]|nr:MAG: hypothetical protein DSO04_02865 [Hadesarchaea archaeon]
MVSRRRLALIAGSSAAAVAGIALARRVLAAAPAGQEYVLVGNHSYSLSLGPLNSVGLVVEREYDPPTGFEWVRLVSSRPISEVKDAWFRCSAYWREGAVARIAGCRLASDLINRLSGRFGNFLGRDHSWRMESMCYLWNCYLFPLVSGGQVGTQGQNLCDISLDYPLPPTDWIDLETELAFSTAGTTGTVRLLLSVYDSTSLDFHFSQDNVTDTYQTYYFVTPRFGPLSPRRFVLSDEGSSSYPYMVRNAVLRLHMVLGPEFLQWLLDLIRQVLAAILGSVPPQVQVQVDTNPGVFLGQAF